MRRRLKSGEFYNLKAWVTGGPYAAVYLTGIKGATRNRKKVYVHRLVADHFLGASKKPNKVVHHEVGPHSNTKDSLKWVTPSENSKARKFFTDDGKRKSKRVKKSSKVDSRAPTPIQNPINAETKAKKPVLKKTKKALPKPKGQLPSDPEEFYPEETLAEKINFLLNKWPPFRDAWKKAKGVNKSNIKKKFREATGKSLKLGDSPYSWNARLLSALHAIERRLES
ncbi:MAG: hypothetical protein MK194_14210 [Roseibacillus sp.]|nr:hypothetical protein [Roseibacillus sp.]